MHLIEKKHKKNWANIFLLPDHEIKVSFILLTFYLLNKSRKSWWESNMRRFRRRRSDWFSMSQIDRIKADMRCSMILSWWLSNTTNWIRTQIEWTEQVLGNSEFDSMLETSFHHVYCSNFWFISSGNTLISGHQSTISFQLSNFRKKRHQMEKSVDGMIVDWSTPNLVL